MKKNVWQMLELVSLYARKFGKGQWSFIGPGSEKKGYSMKEDSPQGIWDKIAERMLLEFAESGRPIFHAHQHPDANEAWKDRIEWITTSQSYRDYDGISGEPTELEWNIFPGFTTLQLYGKVTDLLSRLRETPENFTG